MEHANQTVRLLLTDVLNDIQVLDNANNIIAYAVNFSSNSAS